MMACGNTKAKCVIILSVSCSPIHALIERFTGPTWGPHGSCPPHVGPMLAPWTLLPGYTRYTHHCIYWRSSISRCRADSTLNTLRPRQNGRHFADDIVKCIFLNENVWIPIKISLKFVPKGPINNIPALVQIMAWRRPGDKPLSESMMASLPTHICVTWPQWVKQ